MSQVRRAQLKRAAIILPVVLVTALVVFGHVAHGSAAKPTATHRCVARLPGLMDIFTGPGLTPGWCHAFRKDWWGSHSADHFAGQMRCVFFNSRSQVSLRVFTHDAAVGHRYCPKLKRDYRRLGWVEVKP